ncbi:hypothetical protein BD414DRAFT_164934 [Trametes punicea]|nr:hypothetical protein BD414DRAFT_164934 [Trametes punicea]
MPSPSSLFDHSVADDVYSEFREEESALPLPLPPTINVVDPDILRARRRSDKKAAKLLDITIAREDADFEVGDLSGAGHTEDEDPQAPTLLDSPMIDEGEDVPLVDGSPSKGTRRTKTRRKIGAFFQNFRRRKVSNLKVPRPAPRATLASLVSPDYVQNPFGDEHAIHRDGEEAGPSSDAHSQTEGNPQDGGGSPVAGSTAQWALVPNTPRRTPSASAPTTPGTSPWSAKSKRSVASWQRSPRTPRSAKSWLSEHSPGSLSITSSVTSSLRRKHVRRRERQLASQMKSLQILGSEAGAAVAKASHVKESKLRYREFERQLRDRFKRTL